LCCGNGCRGGEDEIKERSKKVRSKEEDIIEEVAGGIEEERERDRESVGDGKHEEEW
jgi:hypothetical protein